MALSAVAKIGLLVAGTAAAGGVALAAMPKEKPKKKKKSKKARLSGVYVPGATIGGVTERDDQDQVRQILVEDIMLPVELSFLPLVRDPQTQDILPAMSPVVDDPLTLQALVTDLSPEVALTAYELFLHYVANQERNLSNDQQLDKTVREVLAVTAPKVNWVKGIQNYPEGSPEFDVWMGHQLLGEIAYQSYWNKQAGNTPPAQFEVLEQDQFTGPNGTVLWRVIKTPEFAALGEVAFQPQQGFAPDWKQVVGDSSPAMLAEVTNKTRDEAARVAGL